MNDIFVGRLMSTPVHTATPGTSVREAAEAMERNGIGSIVVVDEDDAVVGILTTTDFVRIALDEDSAADLTVEEYMSTDVVTTSANESLRDVADVMIEHEFHHLPVVDDGAGLVGMITTTDLTAYLSHIRTPSPGAVGKPRT